MYNLKKKIGIKFPKVKKLNGALKSAQVLADDEEWKGEWKPTSLNAYSWKSTVYTS